MKPDLSPPGAYDVDGPDVRTDPDAPDLEQDDPKDRPPFVDRRHREIDGQRRVQFNRERMHREPRRPTSPGGRRRRVSRRNRSSSGRQTDRASVRAGCVRVASGETLLHSSHHIPEAAGECGNEVRWADEDAIAFRQPWTGGQDVEPIDRLLADYGVAGWNGWDRERQTVHVIASSPAFALAPAVVSGTGRFILSTSRQGDTQSVRRRRRKGVAVGPTQHKTRGVDVM